MHLTSTIDSPIPEVCGVLTFFFIFSRSFRLGFCVRWFVFNIIVIVIIIIKVILIIRTIVIEVIAATVVLVVSAVFPPSIFALVCPVSIAPNSQKLVTAYTSLCTTNG